MIEIISTGSTLIIAAGIVLVFIKNLRKISFALFAVGFLLLSIAGLLKGYPVALAGLLLSAYAAWNFIRFTDRLKTK